MKLTLVNNLLLSAKILVYGSENMGFCAIIHFINRNVLGELENRVKSGFDVAEPNARRAVTTFVNHFTQRRGRRTAVVIM